VRLLLGERQEGSLTVYADGFRAYNPLKDHEISSEKQSFTVRANTPMEIPM